MIKKLIILLLLLFLLTPVATFADSLDEYRNCVKECYSHEDWNNEQYLPCLNACTEKFPNGFEEAKERLRDIDIDGVTMGIKQSENESWKPIVLNVPIGRMIEVSSFGEYFKTWYSFAIGAVGVLATVMLMWGGFKWLTSRGNSGVISESKQIIWSALIGVVLAFLSYTILYLINPRLTTIGLPTLKTTEISVDESHERCGEVTLTDDQRRIVSNPCGEPEGTYSGTEQTNRQVLAGSGAAIRADVNTAQINDETIARFGAFTAAAPSGSVLITSGHRAGTANHGRGDTIDIDNNGEIDPFMMQIIGSTQGAQSYDKENNFTMTIYKLPPNRYGITRIIDERQKPGASHWHIEF
jgi:hypothetical protein